jgi:hypothetical protein
MEKIMDVKFVVHGVTPMQISAVTQLDGEDVRSSVSGLEVELTSENPRHGSLVLRFVGKEAAEAAEKFKDGETVTWTL